ncbi:LasR-specific antiactivator QslA [Pseudomonas sp. Bi130]|jgi:hypothetical protein|uniref:LasR-specific antiactivator QslA n=1 Tax=unclassified Pseudomonas TaxID=196821 RepID=UPI001DAAA259|nr:LasR-specific antiactivator QslA [Pseudomonas sp. Bi130]CAH0267721.1 hypothetical protein SRABI130_03692 [Pseudomonas sp. Bi130]
MIDHSLLSSLPKPKTIDTSSLSQEEAALTLRRSASFRLNGAQSLILHATGQEDLAVELLDDAAVLYDMALQRLLGRPPERARRKHKEYYSIPAADGRPGIQTPWGSDYAPMIEDGVRCAEEWLEDSSSLPLWWALSHHRKRHWAGDCQDSFEAGFLLRLQQRLVQLQSSPPPTSTRFEA